MTTQKVARWSLWRAALAGSVISAVLVVMHFARGVEPYPSQTLAGQIAYWFGFAGMYPIVFVSIAAIRNAFAPKNSDAARGSGGVRNFFWPTSFKDKPSGFARFGRVLHWLFAAGAAAFVIGGGYYALSGNDLSGGLSAIVFGGSTWLLMGRAIRYILAGE